MSKKLANRSEAGRHYDMLAMDVRAFRTWARLMHGRSDDLIEDAMIAAFADVHGLIVVTRNIRDFKKLGVKTLSPFHRVECPHSHSII